MASGTIDGISSGLNTTEIVEALLTYERRTVASYENDSAIRTNSISTLQALQAKLLALNNEAKRLTRASTFETAKIAVSDPTALTARANGRVGTGSYNLTVQSIARNHQLASQGYVSDTAAVLGTGTFALKVGDGSLRTITVDGTNNSLQGLSKSINALKMGVTATVINDGSESNPYRLLLTGDNTGIKNRISVTTTLTGGTSLNYDTATFDAPEKLVSDDASTAGISLGSTAANSGTGNKTFTFTVGGSGTQTIGTDVISINWSDGTNSGSIALTQADTEIDLVGTGADGLKLTFTDGTLTAGDTFQVTSFAPVVQQSSDAKVTLGGSGSSGSPITVASTSNSFATLVPGMAVTVLKETEAGESITVNAEPDLDGIRSTIQTFVQRYNEVTAFIREQSSYDNETKTAGALYGDFTLTTADRSLSNALGSRISGIESNYNQLFSIGIRSTLDGRLAITDNSRLDKALRENLDDVIKLFTSSGSSTSTGIEYISSSSKTRTTTDVAVNVTRAASQGFLTSTTLTKPETTPIVLTNANNRLRLTIDGLVSDEIILTNGTYATSDELIDELQTKINEDAKIGARGVKVEWLPGGATTGTIRVSSASYGSASKVGIVASIPSSAYAQLGLAAAISSDGVDVAGTLNGEAAEGKGQTLTGKKGNKTTEGLSVKVGLADELVTDDVEGSLTLSRGIASRIESVVTNLTLSKDGVLDRKIKGYQGQIDDLTERIEQYNLRIQIRRQSLFEKFFAMEEAVGQLNSQGAFLSAQLSGLSASLSSIGSRTTTSGRQRRT